MSEVPGAAGPDSGHAGDGSSASGPAQGMPRWVKVFVGIAIVLAVLAVVALLAPGDHGPGRHGPGMH
jgi:hypothetical protein